MTGVPAARSETLARWCWYALLVALAVWGAALGSNPRRAGDLRIYVEAAERFWRGAALYPAADGEIGFKYAPATAWLFAPFALLPIKAAAVLWNVGSVAAFAFATAAWRTLLAEDARYRATSWGFTAATLALAQSFFLELFHGQVDLFLLALLVWPFTPAGRRRDHGSGLCLAIAVLLKPPAAVIAAAFFAMHRRRAIVASVAWVAALHLPLALRYGLAGTAEQIAAWTTMLRATAASWGLGHNPQGLPTLLLSIFHPHAPPPAAAQAIADAASLTAAVAAPLSLRLREPALVSALCLGAALASPIAWRANFVLAWPLIATVLCVRARRPALSITWTAVGVVALVEWVIGEAMLGSERARAALAARPWAIAFVLLTATALWSLPKEEPPASEAAAPEESR